MATEHIASAEHGAEALHADGMPQLDFATWPNTIFWLLVALVVLYFLLSRLVIPRVEEIISTRKTTITADLARAEELKRQAEEAEETYRKALAEARAEARRIIDEADAELKRELERAKAEAEARIAEMTAAAEARIAEIRASARTRVAEIAREVAHAVVEAILPGKVKPEEVAKAVTARIEEGQA